MSDREIMNGKQEVMNGNNHRIPYVKNSPQSGMKFKIKKLQYVQPIILTLSLITIPLNLELSFGIFILGELIKTIKFKKQ
jgi:hypothetical protein